MQGKLDIWKPTATSKRRRYISFLWAKLSADVPRKHLSFLLQTSDHREYKALHWEMHNMHCISAIRVYFQSASRQSRYLGVIFESENVINFSACPKDTISDSSSTETIQSWNLKAPFERLETDYSRSSFIRGPAGGKNSTLQYPSPVLPARRSSATRWTIPWWTRQSARCWSLGPSRRCPRRRTFSWAKCSPSPN